MFGFPPPESSRGGTFLSLSPLVNIHGGEAGCRDLKSLKTPGLFGGAPRGAGGGLKYHYVTVCLRKGLAVKTLRHSQKAQGQARPESQQSRGGEGWGGGCWFHGALT